MANGEAGAFFAADHDFVLLDEFADVFEADREFRAVDDVMMLGEGVDQVGGGYGFAYAVFPTAGFDEVIEKQRNDVIGLEEGSVLIDDAEAVGVAIGGNADVGVGVVHFAPEVSEQMIVGLGSMAAK